MTRTDTIVAAATPPGRGGVGIVRISGPKTPELAAVLVGELPAPRRATFAFFPAGLVLYWVTNTILSIAQQWNINRRIAAQPAKKN